MKSAFTILSFLIFNVLFVNLYAATYYVSLNGKNSNNGTSQGGPWYSISRVNSQSFRGDTILFQGGSTFTGSLYFDPSDIGTSSKPIVIGSYGTGKATISSDTLYGIFVNNAAGFKIKNLIFKGSGRTTNRQAGILFYMDKDSTSLLPFINIDNVEVFGYRNAGISIGSWNKKGGFRDIRVTNSLLHDNGSAGIGFYAESLYVHKNIYIGHSKTYNNSGIAEQTTGNSGSGIILGHVNGAVIEYCTAYNNGWLHSNTYGGPVGMWAYGSNNVTMQFNESHHNKTGNTKDGGGFDLDACNNSVIQYNYSHDNYGAGYLLARYSTAPSMNNLTVRYNISENDGRKNDYGGIHLWTSSSGSGMQSVQIYNNTIFLTPAANATPRGLSVRAGIFKGINVRNNIFQTTGAVPVVYAASVSGFTFQGNDYWSSGSTFKIYWAGTTYSSLSAWRTATNQEKINGSASGLQADPQFSDTTTGVTFSDASLITTIKRYKLRSTSGLINKGLNLTTLFGTNVGTRDFWGNSLANKSTFNIGAYQLTTGAKGGNNLQANQENEIITKATLQVFPNPVRSSAIINFSLPVRSNATLLLYNLKGQLESSLFSGQLEANENKKMSLDASALASGEYILRLSGGEIDLTRKLLINR
jgi:hypothetical protein